MNKSTEFWCLWLECSQQWILVMGDGLIEGGFRAVGYATQRAMKLTGRAEVQWQCDDIGGIGSCYQYKPDDEFWVYENLQEAVRENE